MLILQSLKLLKITEFKLLEYATPATTTTTSRSKKSILTHYEQANALKTCVRSPLHGSHHLVGGKDKLLLVWDQDF